MKYYYTPGTVALAPHIALELVGATYQAIKVDLQQGEQRTPEYLALNPLGRVPALVVAEGAISETPAILSYISQRFPHAKLAPVDDLYAQAQLNAFNSFLSSTVHVAHAHLWRGQRWADDPSSIAELKRKAPQNMADCFQLIENDWLKTPWVLGDELSICDIYLFTITRWLEGDGVDLNAFDKVKRHFERMMEIEKISALIETHYQ